MSDLCFLLDEHIPIMIKKRLQEQTPEIRVYSIGAGVAPSRGTPDPDLLSRIEANGCMVLTNNRATMPVHLAEHLVRGGHVPGSLQMPKHPNIGETVDDLSLIWGASLPDEFQDQIVHLPLRR